jgi:serine/threonine protein kinase
MIDEKGHLKVINFGTVRKKGFYFDKKEMKFKEEKIETIDSEDIKGVKNVVNPDEDGEEEEEEDENEENNNNINNKNIKGRVQRSMTFVGTAEYISPEVIADKPAEFGTDIWAFGVMLYQMIFNTTPFKDQSAYLTFRKIESAKIKYPTDSNDISEEAKDLLNKIFVVDPKKRLGGGDLGTEYDINHLKKHKYFKNINWNNLKNMTPPGFNTYKYYESKRKSIYKKKGNNGNNNENDGYKVFDDKSNNDDIKVIKEGYINKQSFWFHYVKKYISLDTTPRIVVTNIDENGTKKVIQLNRKCKVSIVKDNCFELKTPEKNHKFKGLANDGNDWAGIISDVINDYGVD